MKTPILDRFVLANIENKGWVFYLDRRRFRHTKSPLIKHINIGFNGDINAALSIVFDFTPPPKRNELNWGYYLMIEQPNKPPVFINDGTVPEDKELLNKYVPESSDKQQISKNVAALLEESLRLVDFPDYIIRGPMTEQKLAMPRYVAVTKEFERLGYITDYRKDKFDDSITYIHHQRSMSAVSAQYILSTDEGLLNLAHIDEVTTFYSKNYKRLQQESLARVKEAMKHIKHFMLPDKSGFYMQDMETGEKFNYYYFKK